MGELPPGGDDDLRIGVLVVTSTFCSHDGELLRPAAYPPTTLFRPSSMLLPTLRPAGGDSAAEAIIEGKYLAVGGRGMGGELMSDLRSSISAASSATSRSER